MPQEIRHWSKQTNPLYFLLDPDSRFTVQKSFCLYFQKKQKIHLSLNNEKWILINFYKILVIHPDNSF